MGSETNDRRLIEVINLYCDESCHLEHDNEKVMGLGSVSCPARRSYEINHELAALKREHEMPSDFELKWTKVGKSKIGYYEDVVNYFFDKACLRFRGLIVPDKGVIDHSLVPGQTHDQWYYKMYYVMLKQMVSNPHDHFQIYIDIKDTRGFEKIERLWDVLCTSIFDSAHKRITRIQEVRSDQVELIQLADFILGAVVYTNRGEFNSPWKRQIADLVAERSGISLLQSTSFARTKVNLYMWDGGAR